MREFEIRDPVHGRITFNEFERKVIDHPFFQRLRFIGQLSFLQSYVYPGAVHSRFSHCIGSMHVAGRLFDRIIESPVLSDRLTSQEIHRLGQTLRLAGLLHDIGHGPFSHSSESVFPQLQDLPLDWSWWRARPDRQAKHEDYSVLFIQALSKEGLFPADVAQDIASLVHGEVIPSDFFRKIEQKTPTLHQALKGLVSGEVDCDRMDYLLRDSYFCGVAYGKYDLEWVISSLQIVENEGKYVLMVPENGVRAIEGLLFARYHMIDQVYFHKTKGGFTYYLEQSIKEREVPLIIPADPYAYARMRDDHVIEMLFAAANDSKNYWAHHLMNRIAAKRIVRLQHESLEDMALLERLKSTCEESGIKHFTRSASSRVTHYGDGLKGTPVIYVERKRLGTVQYIPIYEYSDLLQKYNEKIQFTDFFVLREDVGRLQNLDLF